MNKKSSIISKIDAVILGLVIAYESFFFSINVILNREYSGSENTLVYRSYLFILLMYLCLRFVLKIRRIRYNQLFLLMIPILFVVAICITKINFNQSNSSADSALLYVIVWQYMGILLAFNLNNKKTIDLVSYYFELYVLIITASVCIATFIPYFSGRSMTTMGGASYQTTAYYSAFAFGMTLYYLNQSGKEKITVLGNGILIKVVRVICILVQFVSLTLAGGRGAMILFIAYAWYFVLQTLKSHNKKKIILFFALSMTIILLLNSEFLDSDIYSKSINRIFSYITPNGFDLSQTSGRDIIYKACIELIGESPLYGYGIFSYYYLIHYYPHNIFLEIMFEGGGIYLSIWLLVFLLIIRKIHFMRINKFSLMSNKFVTVLAFYPLCFLMFSGSYSYCMLFWFILSLFITIKHEGETICLQTN